MNRNKPEPGSDGIDLVIGLERLTNAIGVQDSDFLHADFRWGLLLNQASITRDGSLACDAIQAAYPNKLAALFSPQHGIWGEEQANMIETGHATYAPLQLPVYSLYSETRRPTDWMLKDVDALLVDLQDVGTRVYTFIWTVVNCLHSCAELGKQLVILDRPNPIGGLRVSGKRLDLDYRSFVGLADIPMQHGLTIGELTKWYAARHGLGKSLTIVPMLGWKRKYSYADCKRPWILPSPNMPTYRTTCVYPGGVLLEGTNLSEGRGTTIPFEVVGAPYIDDEVKLATALNHLQLDGVRFRPTRFRPTFDKWRGASCRGVHIDVTDETAFDSYRSTLHILHLCRRLYPKSFEWLPPPYEYEQIKMPIDILTGSSLVREAIDQQCRLEVLDELAVTEPNWWTEVQEHLLYD